jgi:hypothetical protein
LIRLGVLVGLTAGWFATPAARAEDAGPDAVKPAADPNERFVFVRAVEAERQKKPSYFRYTLKGTQIGSEDGFFSSEVNIRSQLRFSTPFASAPRKESHFSQADENDVRFKRARFKADGHVYKPWIEYKYEHDLVDGRLLDARMTIKKFEWLQFRFGQWKADYSRERKDSSGKQEFVERSIVNRAFTIDRQKGAVLLGRVLKQTPFDSQYYVGVFRGNGRGFLSPNFDRDHSDGKPMWLARYQWNPLGGGVGNSPSDLEYHSSPAISIATATTSNTSRYTRFSSSGGGQLDGFQDGAPGQYSLKQYLGEAALKYRGLYLQHETHSKRVVDNFSGRTVNMRGAYVQAGYFFHYLFPWVPRKLELGGRYAFVDPNQGLSADLQTETAFVANWFFYGHQNKISFDTSRYTLARGSGRSLKTTGARLQWDVSF